MKPGMMIGLEATITTVVTPDMFAKFEGKVIHPAFSTVSMVYYMEWAARQIILPYLGSHEEGIGGAINVRHLAPTLEGDTITFTATLTELKGRQVITEVIARNNHELVGKGKVTQFILEKQQIGQMLHVD